LVKPQANSAKKSDKVR